MHVPIGDQDALDSMLALGVARGDRNVVEDAESHALVRARVMPGGRTAQNAFAAFFSKTVSTQFIRPPAASRATSSDFGLIVVSPVLSLRGPRRYRA